ncbi:hypothetical protein BX616_002498 [Lobosporangium transversale]|nr:hypothetical protein BX616_002498 [Lobosporangium transversale]
MIKKTTVIVTHFVEGPGSTILELCNNVVEFTGDTYHPRNWQSQAQALINFFVRNTKLRSVTFWTMPGNEHSLWSSLIDTMAQLNRLTELDLTFAKMDLKMAKFLTSLSSTLTRLRLTYGGSTDGVVVNDHFKNVFFKSLKSITFGASGTMDLFWILTAHSPSLKKVAYYSEWSSFKEEEFPRSGFFAGTAVHSLGLRGGQAHYVNGYPECKPTDLTLSKVLDRCEHIDVLSMRTTGFGPRCFSSLMNHKLYLTELSLISNPKFTSTMAQECLSNMECLVTFCFDAITASDIVDGLDNGKPWLCKRLRFLKTSITGLPSIMEILDKSDESYGVMRSMHLKVFEQLSALVKLETLDLSYPPQYHGSTFRHVNQTDGVWFSLEAGLEKLESLNQLKTLATHRVNQKMTVEDAHWMKQHWSDEFTLYVADHLGCNYQEEDPEITEEIWETITVLCPT